MRLPFILLPLALAACSNCSKPHDDATDASDGAVEAPSLVSDGGVINATALPTAIIYAALNPDKLPAYSGPVGSVEGTVTVTGDPPVPTPFDFKRCADAESIYGTSFRKAPNGALADAIVVVTGYSGFFVPETKEAAQIRIEGCGYSTRTLTMTFGQRIEVKNLTRDFWTPILEPGTNSVIMMAAPMGDPVKIYPKKAGHWLLLDHDRKYAVTDVFAFKHPLHAATDIEGHFRIDGVPVGKLQLGVMHPRFEASARVDVDVKPNVVQRVDVVLVHKFVDAGVPSDRELADAGAPRSPLH